MKNNHAIMPAIFATLLFLLGANVALADEPKPADKPQNPPAPAATPQPAAATPTATPAPAPKSDITAIVGGDIHTVSREMIRRGTILIKDGKILQVGQNLTIPPGATVIDAKGKQVAPGYVTLRMGGIALRGGAASGGGRRGGGRGGPGGPASGNISSMEDNLDPYDRLIKFGLGTGITTGCAFNTFVPPYRFGRNFVDRDLEQARIMAAMDHENDHHQPLNEAEEALASIALGGRNFWRIHDHDEAHENEFDPICSFCAQTQIPLTGFALGLGKTDPVPPDYEPIDFAQRFGTAQQRPHAAIKFAYGKLKEMMIKETPFHDISYFSISGPSNRFNFRGNLQKAKKYVADLDEHETNVKAGKKSTAPTKSVDDSFVQIVKQEIPVRISASTVAQIRDVVSLSKEFGFKLVIEDAHEAWMVAEEISSAKASVILIPRSLRNATPGKDNESGSSIETAALLEKAGVPFAVAVLLETISDMGLAGRDLTSLPLEAAFAVRGGCSEKAALAALTLYPAQMMGLDNRIGSIDEGKDADILILNGSPLDYRTYVEKTLVHGRVAYDRKTDAIYPVFERP